MAAAGNGPPRDFGPKGAGADLPPLLLHFDVNKSIIISDMIMNKSVEYSIREVIANQFWGFVDYKKDADGVPAEQPSWIWLGKGPSVDPPQFPEGKDREPISYLRFCRKKIKDQNMSRLATRSFDQAGNVLCKQQMCQLSDETCEKMQVAPKLRGETLKQSTGLANEWKLIFPSFFKFIAHLQYSGRKFCVFFRSFGSDLPRIKVEWNAFCNMKHPLYNHYLDGVGPMNGTVQGVPDRRLRDEDVNTMYRDAEGACLALNIMTNGNWEGEWDQWARSKSGEDSREGRLYLHESGADVLFGYAKIKDWCQEQLAAGRSQLVRDDFAWWHRNGEAATAGKLLIGLEGVQQVFFDDNIDLETIRIVDPRSSKSFEPVPVALTVNTVCLRVDPLLAMLHESYFLDAFEAAGVHLEALDYFSGDYFSGDACASGASPTGKGRVESLADLIEDLEEGEENIDALEVGDVDDLCQILKDYGVDVSLFGAPGTTYKTVQTLHQEIMEGKCYLKRNDADGDAYSDVSSEVSTNTTSQFPLLRVLEVVKVRLTCNNLVLVESHEQMPDGRLRSRNGFLPATKKRKGENLFEAVGRWGVEELQIKLTEDQKREAVASVQHHYDVIPESMSYPLPCTMHYLEVVCHLQSQTMEPVLLERLGLPGGGMFSTVGVKKKKGQATKKAGSRRFWCWYNAEILEAMQQNEQVELPDIEQGMAILFEGHERRQGYQQLLMQMFDSFSASKLCGGMSGSLVLQVQPVDAIDGKNLEPMIVKLDKAQVVSREIVFSKRVCEVLPDRAARIIGDGCFVTDDNADEYGAFKLELAGGCWQVPELAGGAKTKDLLSTFKDLFVINSERQLLNEDLPMIQSHLFSVHGDVEAVLRELLGPGGMLRVLRREGLARNPANLFNSYFYTGKDTRWNPLFKPGHFQRPPMEAMWRRTFGRSSGIPELPDVRKQVLDMKKDFEAMDQTPMGGYMPVVGLAHGDLNAMNVLIDVMDAVWIIDFAFSEEKPICWDLAKLEIAFMFEYAMLPVCWRTLLAFAGETEEEWKERKVHAWLNVCEATTFALLKELKDLRQRPPTENRMETPRSERGRSPSRRKSFAWGTEEAYDDLGIAIEQACDVAWPEPITDKAHQKKKDTELLRLHAVLLASEDEEEKAMAAAGQITDTMLMGSDLTSVMEPPELPSEAKAPEGASLAWCWSKCERLRLFFKEEWDGLQKRVSRELGGLLVGDESPLLFWLGLLQESHRLLGYFDVAPWVKVWAVYYLQILTTRIREHSSPPDALDRVQLAPRAMRDDSKKKHIPCRRFPDSFELRLRGSCMNGVARRRRVEKAAAKQIRKAHAETPGVRAKGGLFAKVLGVKKVKLGRRELSFRIVTYDLAAAGDAIPFGIDGCPDLGVVQVKDDATRSIVKLKTTVVPLPAESVGREAVRVESVRATAEVPIPHAEPIVLILSVSEDAVFCYPPGTRLRIQPDLTRGFGNEASQPVGPGGRLRHGTVIEFREESGKYAVRWDGKDSVDGTKEVVEVNPVEDNHLVTYNYQHPENSRLVVYREPDRFVDVMVVGNKKDPKETASHQVRSLEQGASTQDWWVELNDFNHAVLGPITTTEYEAEVQRYKVSRKAKHSLIWTVTSERADCLEGPVPRVADSMNDELSFWSEVQALLSETDERLGSQTLLKGLLILGQPGSGKSCVLCKIVMQCLSRSKLLIPILIPVVDLVNRIEREEVKEANVSKGMLLGGATPQLDGESLIDSFLRSCFGDDTQRYFMLTQALQSHRLLLLFDGLDEAGAYSGRVERCLTALVAQDHRVIATARMEANYDKAPRSPRVPKNSHMSYLSPTWLKTAPDLFKVVELLPFNSKDRKCMVEVLLSREADLTGEDSEKCEFFVEEFIDMLEEDEKRKWNTPLMVAMLVASWREKRRQESRTKEGNIWGRRAVRRSTSSTDGGDAVKAIQREKDKEKTKDQDTQVDIQSIYSVALDLLLRRFQSRLQADRHKMKESVENFKRLLEVIATKLSRDRQKIFSEKDVLPLLEENKIEVQVWQDLQEAIKAGRVPLLLSETDEDLGETRFHFAYGSFQRFLSRRDEKGKNQPDAVARESSDRDLTRSERRSSRAHIHTEVSPAVTPREHTPVTSTLSGTNGHFAVPAAEGKSFVASPRVPALQMTDTLLRKKDEGVESLQSQVTNKNGPSVSHAGHHPESARLSALSPRARVYTEPLAALRLDTRLDRKSEVAGELLEIREIFTSTDLEMPPLPRELKAHFQPRTSYIAPLPPPLVVSSLQRPKVFSCANAVSINPCHQ